MIRKIRSYLLVIASAVFLALPAAAPAFADTPNITGNLCAGASLSIDSGPSCADTSIGTERINNIIHNVINIFSLIVGVTAVLMIIVGGFRYITSGGDSSNVSGAKNTIIYAIIGLVVVALAQFIVQFVLNKIASTGN